ncbi:hypothetical protein J2Z62_000799 [Mycoplasmoides fastidiosum]|uniref:Uncharacterized protein n=1 Tax=Mycoplasmoides fastidiosum TaxID=92758 RepID=A0ABU0M076_9BACT|nr:hypothetical protein [Mycoplasmoides fastidiosum]MDQ0514361.1 hypothetical protein [Mycoplasmoides fastidiosum]
MRETRWSQWGHQKIAVALVNQEGDNLTPDHFADIDWLHLYANANGLDAANLNFKDLSDNYNPTNNHANGASGSMNRSATNNGYDFLTQVLGQLPYYNGRKKAQPWTNATNTRSVGIDLTKFATIENGRIIPNSPSFNLIITAPNQEWTYRYTINVLTDTTYTLNAKNASSGQDARKFDVAQSPDFNHRFKFASSISPTDLANDIEQWTAGTNYVQNYIKNDASSIHIKSVDLIKNEIVVGFDVKDPNNNKLTIDDIILTGFPDQRAFLIDNDKPVTSFDDQNHAPNQFAPHNSEAAIAWIKEHVGVRWIGLTKTDKTLTTNLTNNSGNGLAGQNIHKLADLANPERLISGLFFNKNDGTLSFTLQISATPGNGGINLVENYTITTFKKFSFAINVANVQNDLAALDYNDDKLKTFVTLKTFQTIQANEINVTSKKWSDATAELAQFLPPETQLQLTDVNPNPEVGSIDFAVSLFEQKTNGTLGDLIDVKTASLFGLSNFNSVFAWKQNNDPTSGIAIINHPQYQDKPVTEFKQALLDNVNDSAKFSALVLPLINFDESAPTFDQDKHLSGATSLTEEQKQQLVMGFGGTASLDAAAVENDVTPIVDANLVGINFLTIKGGYLNGKFYVGTATDAPISVLPPLLVALKPNTTQIQAINNSYRNAVNATAQSQPNNAAANPLTYQGGTALFQDALNREWKNLLPSEWLAQLRRLKNRQNSQLISQTNYQAYDTLTGFLNHVLTTSTSNSSYQTHVDLTNFSNIEVNNSTGEVKIAANTLLINNVYENPNQAERRSSPQIYQPEISFFLSNYFSRIDETTKAQLPYANNADVNRTFINESVLGIVNQLEDLFTKAQKFYNNITTKSLTNAELLAAQDAINILKFKFIHPVYYTNPDAEKFLTVPFGSNDVDANHVGKMTKFSALSFSNLNYNEGSLDITVKVENYIDGFNGQYFTVADKEQTFKITNTLGTFLLPTWKNYAENNFKLRTDDNQLTALDGQPISGVITNDNLQTWKVVDYYHALISHTNSAVNDAYISLNYEDSLFDLVTWKLVDNSGIEISDTSNYHQQALTILKEQLEQFNVSLNVRKQDVYYSEKNEQVYLLNPFLHFNVPPVDVDQLKILQTIFDPNKANVQLINNFGNYQNIGLSNVIIQGFQRQPIIITAQNYQDRAYELNFDGMLKPISHVSGSEILHWLKTNLHEPEAINIFLQSFLRVQGFSRITQPLSLVLNPDWVKLLSRDAPVEEMTQYLLINDGIGQFTFLPGSIQIINSYLTNEVDLNAHPIDLAQFLANPIQARIELTNLKLVNTAIIVADNEDVPTRLVHDGIQSNIRDATTALQAENFALAYRYLQLNEVLVSENNNQGLIIHGVHSDIVKGTIIIQYEIKNAFVDGRVQNLQKELVITGFNSNGKRFLKTHLPWILIVLIVTSMGIYYAIWRFRYATNSIKFMQKNRYKIRAQKQKQNNASQLTKK